MTAEVVDTLSGICSPSMESASSVSFVSILPTKCLPADFAIHWSAGTPHESLSLLAMISFITGSTLPYALSGGAICEVVETSEEASSSDVRSGPRALLRHLLPACNKLAVDTSLFLPTHQ